jgi:long-chain acyl-CoA synthetase
VAGPMYHTGPNGWANVALGLGNTLVILESFDPEDLLRQVEREQVTTTFMVPTMLRMLTKHPAATPGLFDTSSLRVLISAGEPCPMPLKRDVADRFGPVLYEFAGASELGVLSVIGPEEHEKRPGSCGQLIDPDAVTIRDDDGVCVPPGVEGVIWVKSATLASYWNRPDDTAEATSSDGAMTVWDLGYVDDDGYLYITGRTVDVIKTGGVKVTPTEIESVLLEHPSVVEASVVGMPDAEWGERVVACYRATTDQPVDPDELDAWCRDRLARPTVPKEYVYMSAARWPRQETGKVPKRLLRDLLGGVDAMPTARSDKS